MVKVRFENVNIYRNITESKEFCFAYMVIKDEQIPVQLQKASNGEWVAISLSRQTLHLLTATKNDTMEDWFERNDAEIYGSVAKPTEFSH